MFGEPMIQLHISVSLDSTISINNLSTYLLLTLPLIDWELSTSWTNPLDNLRIEAWSKAVVTKIHNMNIAAGLSNEFVYMNDAGEWQVDQVWAGIPAANLQRMLEVREAYDPLLTFRNLNWGGFKLPM